MTQIEALGMITLRTPIPPVIEGVRLPDLLEQTEALADLLVTMYHAPELRTAAAVTLLVMRVKALEASFQGPPV